MIYRPFHPAVRGKKVWGNWYWLNDKKKRVFENPDTGRHFATRTEVERVIARLSA